MKVLKIFNYLFEHLALCIGGGSAGRPSSSPRKEVRNDFHAAAITLPLDVSMPRRAVARITSRVVTYSGEIVRHKRHKSLGSLSAPVEMCEESEVSELSPVRVWHFPKTGRSSCLRGAAMPNVPSQSSCTLIIRPEMVSGGAVLLNCQNCSIKRTPGRTLLAAMISAVRIRDVAWTRECSGQA
jgi:hypothetical protein